MLALLTEKNGRTERVGAYPSTEIMRFGFELLCRVDTGVVAPLPPDSWPLSRSENAAKESEGGDGVWVANGDWAGALVGGVAEPSRETARRCALASVVECGVVEVLEIVFE